ncbi:MAG: hypothetical protein AB9828_11290 [Sphaerochaetaceae bacterium]
MEPSHPEKSVSKESVAQTAAMIVSPQVITYKSGALSMRPQQISTGWNHVWDSINERTYRLVSALRSQSAFESQTVFAPPPQEPETILVSEAVLPPAEPEPIQILSTLIPPTESTTAPILETIAIPEEVDEPAVQPQPVVEVPNEPEPSPVPEPVLEPAFEPEAGDILEIETVTEEVPLIEPLEEPVYAQIDQIVEEEAGLMGNEEIQTIVEPLIEENPPVEEIPVEESSETMPQEAADPWADFYVGGEEDFTIFEEGSYYVPLYINSEYAGDIDVLFEGERILVNSSELQTIVGDLLIESVQETLFGGESERLDTVFLNETGVSTRYDYQTFELYLDFPVWMMPLRFLSINSSYISRYTSYGMTGTATLQPAGFSWFSNVSLYSVLDVDLENLEGERLDQYGLFSMQSSNSISVHNLAFDFSYNLSLRNAAGSDGETWSSDFFDYFSFLGYQGFYDFEDKSLRFIFGNVNDYLGYSTDTFGIALEKRYAYGTQTAKGHQFNYEVVLEEPSTVEVFINEKNVYKRELQAGTYRLKDFLFSQGANRGRVVVTPLDNPAAVYEFDFSLGYDSRLLSRGDSLYSMSLTYPTYTLEEFGDVFSRIFAWDSAWLYDDITEKLNDFTLRFTQQIGLTDIFTASYDASMRNNALHVGLSGILVFPWGAFEGNLYTSFRKDLLFGYRSELNYRISGTEDSLLSSFEIAVGYESGRYTSDLAFDPDTYLTAGDDSISAALAFSGRIGSAIRYSMNATASYIPADDQFTWRASLSTGFALIANLSMSGSISMSAVGLTSTPTIRGQIGMSYSVNPNLSVSGSSDLSSTSYLSASLRPGGSTDDSVQFSLSGLDFSSLDSLADHQGTVSYSHSAKLYGLSLRQQYSNSFQEFTTSLSLGMAFAYADGLFGMARNINDNFLLVKPEGALSGSSLAVTRTMSSQPDQLATFLGVGTYTAINPHQTNNVVVYGSGDSSLGTQGSFIYDFKPRTRQGFAVRVFSQQTYSVVSSLLKTPAKAYANYTTSIAKVETDESGHQNLVDDGSVYLFTDDSGFFFLSGLEKGLYEFELFLPNADEEDPPLRVRFDLESFINGKQQDAQVFVLSPINAARIEEAFELEAFLEMTSETDGTAAAPSSRILDPDGTYHMVLEQSMSETQFWEEFYPKRTLLNSVEAVSAGRSDAIVEMHSDQSLARTPSALQKMREAFDPMLFVLVRLRSDMNEHFVRILPDLDNPTSPVEP